MVDAARKVLVMARPQEFLDYCFIASLFASCLNQDTAKPPCGIRVRVPPAFLTICLPRIVLISDRHAGKLCVSSI